MARIAVGGFLHETNCFVPMETDEAHFRRGGELPPLAEGGALLDLLRGGTHGASGFIDALERRHALVPLLWAQGGAGGMVLDAAFEAIAGALLARLAAALPVDAIYLDLHGAMVTPRFEDAEGEILARVRALVGPAVPVVASLDYHANVTARMVAQADALTVYRTYPHVDREQAGARAAEALERILRAGRPGVRVLRQAPFLVALPFQSTMAEPAASLVAASAAPLPAGVLGLGFAAGFPPSDLFECGPSVFAQGWDAAATGRAAGELFARLLAAEPGFREELSTAAEGVAHAIAVATGRDPRPVLLADTQDNPGGGGSGDSTGLLAELVAQRARGAVLAVMTDPEAAAAAHAAGEGAELDLALGGRHGPPGVEPFRARFRVLRIGSGRFTGTGPWYRGRKVDIGPMALLETGGVRVIVAAKRMQAADQAIFRHLGVDPAACRILALKSSVHFRADFQPLALDLTVIAAPGWHQTDPTAFPYRRLRPGVRLRPCGRPFAGPSSSVPTA